MGKKIPLATGDASDRRDSAEKATNLSAMNYDKQAEHISSQAGRGTQSERAKGNVSPHKSTITGK